MGTKLKQQQVHQHQGHSTPPHQNPPAPVEHESPSTAAVAPPEYQTVAPVVPPGEQQAAGTPCNRNQLDSFSTPQPKRTSNVALEADMAKLERQGQLIGVECDMMQQLAEQEQDITNESDDADELPQQPGCCCPSTNQVLQDRDQTSKDTKRIVRKKRIQKEEQSSWRSRSCC